jgi:2-hydroxy-5-methyl-1-naphthoate 7-hydroxylase
MPRALPGDVPGDVPVWVTTSHEETQKLMSDPRVSKNWRKWNAFDPGLIPDDWPLMGMVQVTNMFTASRDYWTPFPGWLTRTASSTYGRSMRFSCQCR